MISVMTMPTAAAAAAAVATATVHYYNASFAQLMSFSELLHVRPVSPKLSELSA